MLIMSLQHRSAHDSKDNNDPHDISFVRAPTTLAPFHILPRPRRRLRFQRDTGLKPEWRFYPRSQLLRRRFHQKGLSSYISIDSAPTPQSYPGQGYVQNNGQTTSTSTGQGTSSSHSPPSPVHNRTHPRIRVSSLLSSYHPRPYRYHLEVVQHPIKTAAFLNASLSRLPLTPPLVARLIVRDAHGNAFVPEDEVPFLVAHLSLFDESGLAYPNTQGPPVLYGNLVSNLNHLEDLQGNMGLFFLFPDVSIRWQGRFRLCVSLTKVASPFSADASGHVTTASSTRFLASAQTHPFEVVSQEQYTAVAPTRLTQAFIRQGARMFSFLPQS